MARNQSQPPQVPGDAPPPAGQAEPELDGADGAEMTEAERLRAQLDAQATEIAQLKAMMAGVVAARAQPPQPGRPAVADLPDESSVDPRAIESPVLTKGGWIVPHNYGSPPPAARLV